MEKSQNAVVRHYEAVSLALNFSFLIAWFLALSSSIPAVTKILSYLSAMVLTYMQTFFLNWRIFLAYPSGREEGRGHFLRPTEIWSSQFYLAYLLTFSLAFYLAYLLIFFLAYTLTSSLTSFWHSIFSSDILPGILAYLLTFFLAFYLASFQAFILGFYLAHILTFYSLAISLACVRVQGHTLRSAGCGTGSTLPGRGHS